MSIKGNTDSIVVRFHSWIFIQSKESADANSELFKEDDDEAMYKNPYEIRLCDLISVSQGSYREGNADCSVRRWSPCFLERSTE